MMQSSKEKKTSDSKEKEWRRRLFDQLEPYHYSGHVSVYNILLTMVILASIFPIILKKEEFWCLVIDRAATVFFLLDYILRFLTADYKFKEKGIRPFARYPFSRMALVDFAAVLPGIFNLSPALRLVKLVRILRAFRFFKLLRYSKNTVMIMRVFEKQKKSLGAVCLIAAEYILVCALIIYSAEPDTFPGFFDAIYWATVSLTTVGYGDIYPVTLIGRIITMISSIFGIAVIAMPAGIITAGFMHELEQDSSKQQT